MTLIEAVAEAQRSGKGFRKMSWHHSLWYRLAVDEDGEVGIFPNSSPHYAATFYAAEILATDWEMVDEQKQGPGEPS